GRGGHVAETGQAVGPYDGQEHSRQERWISGTGQPVPVVAAGPAPVAGRDITQTRMAMAPRSFRAAQNQPHRRVVPSMAAAVDAGRVERAGDSPWPHALLMLVLDAGNDGLLLRVLDQPVRGRRVDAPTVRAAVGSGHAPAIGLMPQHGARCALGDLLA